MNCPHEKVYRNVCVDCLTNVKTGKSDERSAGAPIRLTKFVVKRRETA